MVFSTQEIQFLIQAIDTHVRQTGLQSAAMAANVTTKLQAVAQANETPPESLSRPEPTMDSADETTTPDSEKEPSRH